MSVFENYNIDHLSASSINLYISDPCLWTVKYLFKDFYQSTVSESMLRGTTVDKFLGKVLQNNIPEQNIDKFFYNITTEATEYFLSACNEYDYLNEEKVTKELNNIERFLSHGIEFYKHFGKPSEYQKKIELDIDIGIPVIGYIDLLYEEEKIIRDIKTTYRTPSDFNSVMRQLAIYAFAENKNAEANYIIVNKNQTKILTKNLDLPEERLSEVERTSNAIKILLSISNDRYKILQMFVPDYSSFRWSDNDKEIYNTIMK